MMMSDPWGLLLNQRGVGSIDMSRGFSGFGNLPPLDWMPTPGAEHGVDVGRQFPWNVADSYTYFRWYESVLFKRAREEDRRLLLGDSKNATRMLLAGKFDEIQLNTSAAPRRFLHGVEYELVDIGGFKVWLMVNPFAPRSQGGQPTAPPKSMPDWLEQFAPPSPLDPTASPPPVPAATSPTSSPFETSPVRDPLEKSFWGLLSWASLSNPSASPISPTLPPPQWSASRFNSPSPASTPRGFANSTRSATMPPTRSKPRTGMLEWLYNDSKGLAWYTPRSGDTFRENLSVDTGSILENYAVNTWISLTNMLASFGNTGIQILSDADHFLKKEPAYEAFQMMFPMEGAMGLEMEVVPALAYAQAWMSTSQLLGAVARAPVYWFVGAGGVGAGERAIPMLSPVRESALPAELSAVGQLAQNSSRGNAFQNAVIQEFGLVRNTTTMLGETIKGSLRPTIPDVWAGG